MNNTLHFFGKDPKETKVKGKRDTSLKYFYGALFYFFLARSHVILFWLACSVTNRMTFIEWSGNVMVLTQLQLW